MSYFPFMIQLDDKLCLIAGGGRVAYRKARQLLEFGADIKVVSPDMCEELMALAASEKKITLENRKLEEKDLLDVDVVVLATNDSEVNSNFADICRKKRILVNVVDVKKDCGFYFPAIIKQEEVVIGISTGGSSPLLAARIKEDINNNIRKDYGEIASELAGEREFVINNIPDEDERKRYFEKELQKRL